MVISSKKLAINFEIDFQALAIELASIAESEWIAHVNKRVYQGDWSVVPLRALAEFYDLHPILQSFNIESEGDWQDLPRLAQLPEINNIVKQVKCPQKAVRLMKLEPDANIFPHVDHGLSVENGQARLHVPLQHNDDVEFHCANSRLAMGVGELWYVNADQEHWVKNSGSTSRINLVIDVDANSWLLERLQEESVEGQYE